MSVRSCECVCVYACMCVHICVHVCALHVDGVNTDSSLHVRVCTAC